MWNPLIFSLCVYRFVQFIIIIFSIGIFGANRNHFMKSA